jgi:hypothetical protein
MTDYDVSSRLWKAVLLFCFDHVLPGETASGSFLECNLPKLAAYMQKGNMLDLVL